MTAITANAKRPGTQAKIVGVQLFWQSSGTLWGEVAVTDKSVGEGARYWAFISYSHKDAAFGRRLHRRLEAYLVPQRLVGRTTAPGAVPRRLAPIFRDREEMPAAVDLSAEVRVALQASRSLIVVCSREAAASKWVSREVDLFRALHPDRPILAAICNGEPPDCFPSSLLRSEECGAIVEPLAADFRSKHDGAQHGLLKLVAGMVGIGLDELVQRDAQRRSQRVTAITAAALTSVLAMGALTIFAFNARIEAERQRSEAEGLVEYMLTDLRDKLKGVGRLDVMTAVNQRALKYYSDQDLTKLPPDSLERRAKVLHAMGEDDETRGDNDAALAKFREARRTTAALLAEAPNDPERIFNQAQSEYWIGYIDYNRNRFAAAKPAFQIYKRLSDTTVSLAPSNLKYRREAAYADGNLCSIALEKPKDPQGAVNYCLEALTQIEAIARLAPASTAIEEDVINRHAWLADAYVENGQLAKAKSERSAEERILRKLMASDSQNAELKDSWISLQRALARLEILDKQIDPALRRLKIALVMLDTLIAHDGSNHNWVVQRDRIVSTLQHFQRTTTSDGDTK